MQSKGFYCEPTKIQETLAAVHYSVQCLKIYYACILFYKFKI